MKAYRRWMGFLLILLLAGLVLLFFGVRDYNRVFHPPRGSKTAIVRCIPQDFVA